MPDAYEYAALTFSPQPSVAFFLKGLLDCVGLTVRGAFSSAADLEAAVEREHPDIIVYDIGFPFVANWHALQDLRNTPAISAVPIVVTSSEPRELFRATGASAIELFERPNDVAPLRNALQSAIEAAARKRPQAAHPLEMPHRDANVAVSQSPSAP